MKIFKQYGSKERLLEIFQKVNSLNENEIDRVNYKTLFDALIRNTKIIKDKTLDDIAYRTDDFIKNNIINIEELSDLYKNDIIQNLDGFPIIDNSDYLNYYTFITKVKEALNR